MDYQRNFHKGELMVEAGENQDFVYEVQKGWVRQYRLSLSGGEFTVHFYKPGSVFYLGWLWGKRLSDYFFEAMTPVRAIKWPIEIYREKILSDKEMTKEIITRLMRGLGEVSTRLEVAALGTAQTRIVQAIMNLAIRFGKTEGGRTLITLPLTHRVMGTYTGLARETVSVEIKKLRQLKAISNQRGRWVVEQMDLIKKLSGL